MLPWCLPGCPSDPFLPPWCFASCPKNPFLPPWCLQAVQMVLSCLPGASLSKAILCSEQHFKGQFVLRAANRGAHPRVCRKPGRSPLKLYQKLYKIRRPSKAEIRSAILCYEPPGRLPGASQAVQMVLSCLPGASLVLRWAQNVARGTGLPLTGRHQRGRKGLIGQPARHQGGTREAGKD